MESKRNAKYYILIVVFTLLFFVCMAFCFARYRELSHVLRFESLSYRKKMIERDENMFGPAHNFYSLYFNGDYEEDFDEYWDFSEAYLAYVRGRISEDKEAYIGELKAYLDTEPGAVRKKAVEKYLEELEEHN